MTKEVVNLPGEEGEDRPDQEGEEFPTTPLLVFLFKSVEDIENEEDGDPPNSDELWFTL